MGVPPEKWESVKELLDQALKLTPEAASTFLDNVCPEQDVRREVERLLAYRSQAVDFLSSSAISQISSPTQSRRMEPGALLDGRFRIVRFIAAGGMGEVYEAEDEELRERVAIKTIRQDLMCQPHFVGTFRREVHLAKQVTHPNVCRIYDFFRHSEADGAIVFVSMEFLDGETLGDRLKRRGRMTPKEALPIILQVSEALNAAHLAGILHRDFKPGNVILTASSSPDGVRAVVTDFGLAFQASTGARRGTTTSAVAAMGTPAYMAPEQIEGGRSTESSDLYALGLVMYEMITGQSPFDESTPLVAAAKRLYEPPMSPRKLVPDLDGAWEKIIAQCLQRDPGKRPRTAVEVIAAIRAISSGVAPSGKRKGLAWRALPGIAILLALAAIGAIYKFRFDRAPELTERDTIVVADFANRTGDAVWDDTLKQGLRVDLEQSPYLNILSDEKVAQVLRYMGQSDDTRVTKTIAREVCQRAGSKAILLGSISSIGTNFAIGLEAINCQSEDSLVSLQAEANSRENVLTKLHTLGTEMRRKLGESLVSIARYDIPVEQATTSSLEALQGYSAALRNKRSKGDASALPLLKRAVDLDPNFAMAYAVLGTVYSNLGDTALSSDSAKTAYSLRGRVTERERLYIDSSYYNLVTGELEKEIEVYELWKQTYPRDQIPYQKLAYCNGYLGQYQKATAGYLDALRLEPGDVINYVDLASTYLTLDRLDQASAVLADLNQRQLEHEYVPQVSYILSFLRGDTREMAKWTSLSSWMPTAVDILFATQSDTEAFHGRIQNSRKFSRRAIESAAQNDAAGRAAFWQAHWALREAEVGNLNEARRQALKAVGLDSGEDVQAVAALALARSGEVARARALADSLANRFPTHLWLQRYWLPCIRAAIEMSRSNPAGAVNALQVTGRYELGGDPIALDTLYPVYLRGLAYLMQGQGEAASIEFQKILDHPGRLGNSPLGPLARLQFARACALSAHTVLARSAYGEFLNLWKDADPDISLRREAETEYARLR
jgi:tetratricopeptide (TPR) repeat protein